MSTHKLMKAVRSVILQPPTFTDTDPTARDYDPLRKICTDTLARLKPKVNIESRPQRQPPLSVNLSYSSGEAPTAVNRPYTWAQTTLDLAVYGKSNPSRQGSEDAQDVGEAVCGLLVQLAITREGVAIVDCTEAHRPNQRDLPPGDGSDNWTTVLTYRLDFTHSVLRGLTIQAR